MSTPAPSENRPATGVDAAPARSRAARAARGALLGVLSAAVTVGVGELAAAFVRPAAAPILVVGNRIILLTPEPVKRWAIRSFGTSDKQALLTGIYAVLAVAAMGLGVLALHRVGYGLTGVAAFAALGVTAALTAQPHHASDVIPTLAGAAAGAGSLLLLVRAAGDRRGPPPPAAPDRRRFLQAGLASAGLAALAGYGGRVAEHARFAVTRARDRITLPPPVQAAPGTAGTDLGHSGVPWVTANPDFYRIDTALSVPQLDPGRWRLRIHGMVARELTLSYRDVLARPLIERWITLCCVSNPVGGPLIGNARFLGARLADLLREAGVSGEADQLLMTSADGMTIGAPTAVVLDGRDALLAVGMNGQPLPVEHGFPARVVVPGLYGYVSACKWVVDLQATTFAARRAYWVQAGWAARTDIKLQARIDRPRAGAQVPVGRMTPICGVAWDQHVGVSAVQVQVADGPWRAARLAAVPSTDTWRQWVLPWTPPRAGTYTVRVRALDAAGRLQPEQASDVFPAGATGWHAVTVRAG